LVLGQNLPAVQVSGRVTLYPILPAAISHPPLFGNGAPCAPTHTVKLQLLEKVNRLLDFLEMLMADNGIGFEVLKYTRSLK
jgi:hypothetical protein